VCEDVAVTSIAPRNWVSRLLAGDDAYWPTRFMFSLHGATLAARRQVITHAEDPARAIAGWQSVAARCPVILNYALHDQNTRIDDAVELVALLRGREDFAELRLSPLNSVPGSPLTPARRPEGFIAHLREDLPEWRITEYAPLGTAVEAGCGQLRSRATSSTGASR
jgi:23S rRNA (adenine2503-C2)-methyltransferase